MATRKETQQTISEVAPLKVVVSEEHVRRGREYYATRDMLDALRPALNDAMRKPGVVRVTVTIE
jgi:hypothetical protein